LEFNETKSDAKRELNFRKSIKYFANLGTKFENIDMNEAIGKFINNFSKNERIIHSISRFVFEKFSKQYSLNPDTLIQIEEFLKHLIGGKDES